jgi:hypothetical protein
MPLRNLFPDVVRRPDRSGLHRSHHCGARRDEAALTP